jgi:hypothetical protein
MDSIIYEFNKLLSGELKELKFSKGYREYEKYYELFKTDLEKENIERIEQDNVYTLVILRRYERD